MGLAAGDGEGRSEAQEQVGLSPAPRPSTPDMAAVPETGPGGQREEEHGGGPTMFRRERNELSIMGPTHLSRGDMTRGELCD